MPLTSHFQHSAYLSRAILPSLGGEHATEEGNLATSPKGIFGWRLVDTPNGALGLRAAFLFPPASRHKKDQHCLFPKISRLSISVVRNSPIGLLVNVHWTERLEPACRAGDTPGNTLREIEIFLWMFRSNVILGHEIGQQWHLDLESSLCFAAFCAFLSLDR